MLCTSGFVADVTFSYNGLYGASLAFLSSESVIAETLESITTILLSDKAQQVHKVGCALREGAKSVIHDAFVTVESG